MNHLKKFGNLSLLQKSAILAPFFFVLGASMELFMIKTGFYEIVTRKEGERRLERENEEDIMKKRLAELKIDFSTSISEVKKR